MKSSSTVASIQWFWKKLFFSKIFRNVICSPAILNLMTPTHIFLIIFISKMPSRVQKFNNNKVSFWLTLKHGRTKFWKLIKMFSNHSDFCFHITVPKILDKKSLYGRKKNIPKIFEKNPTFFKIITEERWWRNFSLIFSESTKNLVVIIHRS